VGEITELEFAKKTLRSQMLHKMSEALLKADNPDVDTHQAREAACEILAAMLLDNDVILPLYTLWLAERLSPPCSDENWQHTLQLLLNAITEAWRLSGALDSPSLPAAPPEEPLMLLEIQGMLKMGKAHEN
jgi:hypothetical protein